MDQGTVSNWNEGGHEALANLHAVQDGNTLAVHLAARIGRATPTVLGRSILLFIDSKSGGRTFIPNNLINYGGEENYINNLGTSSSVGMTFETGFTPDYAVRIYGDGATGAFVNLYDLNAGTRTEAGNAGVDAGVINKGFITPMKANNLGTGSIAANTTAYAAANTGVEMKLSLSALGVPSGAQPVRLMALLVDTDSMYGSNQVLATRSSNSDIAYGINSINFGSEANTQYIPISVTGPASRNVVFSVNMNDEITNGNFTAGTDKVKVIFFSGVASPTPGEIFLTGPEPGNIYTGTLVTEGATAASFGNYKFFNTRFGAPNAATNMEMTGPSRSIHPVQPRLSQPSSSGLTALQSGPTPSPGTNPPPRTPTAMAWTTLWNTSWDPTTPSSPRLPSPSAILSPGHATRRPPARHSKSAPRRTS